MCLVDTPAVKLMNLLEKNYKGKRNWLTEWITCDQLSLAWFLSDYARSIVGEENHDLITKTDTFYATVELTVSF